MNVTFKNQKLQSLYETGIPNNRYNFPADVIDDYIVAIDLINSFTDVRYIAAHIPFRYHKLHGNKDGIDAIRINNQGYRMELEATDANNVIINDVSLHYGD